MNKSTKHETAYRIGRALNFDPATETIRNDEEADRLLTKDYRAPWRVATR